MGNVMKLAVVAAAALSVVQMTTPADAACQRMGFLVNDYGKDGPSKDAKQLLDKHIAKTLAAKGITKYTTGTKSVSCELFLNFIVFDEHTCTASATVCYDGTPLPKGETAAAAEPSVDKPVAGKAVAEKKSAAKASPKSDVVKTSATKPAAAVKDEAKAAVEAKPAAAAAATTAEPAKASNKPAWAAEASTPAP
jgi:hypothetical protein